MINKNRLSKAKADDDFISRADLAVRWGCHIETLKRRERQGSLHPVRFSERMVRYPLHEVRALEQEAGGNCPVKQKQMRNHPVAQPRAASRGKGVAVELQP